MTHDLIISVYLDFFMVKPVWLNSATSVPQSCESGVGFYKKCVKCPLFLLAVLLHLNSLACCAF